MIKKIFAVALSATMALGLVACGSNSETVGKGEIKLNDYASQLYVYQDDMDSYVSSYSEYYQSYLLSAATETKTIKKGKVKKDSKVNVDYKGEIKVDGKKVAFQGGTAEAQSIDIANDQANYIEGFVSSLIGHKVGDTFTAKLAFPETYTNNTTVDGKEVSLAGQTVWFTYTINSLEVSKQPKKLTDKIVATNAPQMGLPADITTVKKFDEYLNDYLSKQFVSNYVMQKLMDEAEVVKFDPDEESSAYEKEKESVAAQYSASFDDYLEACSISEEDWKANVKENVENNLKSTMLIKALCEELNLSPSDKEYKKEAESLGGGELSVDELESQYGKDTVNMAILSSRLQDYISEHVEYKKGSEPTTTAAENEETTEAK